MPASAPLRSLRYNGTAYGIALGIATLLAAMFLAHHPIPDVHPGEGRLTGILAVAGMDRWMHGALIGVLTLFALCFWGFSWRLGIGHPLVMGAWLSYLLGTVFTCLAGLIDGYLVSDVAAAGGADAEGQVALLFILIQGLTRLGLVFIGVAGILWGHALLHHKGGARWIGFIAMATGGLSAGFILTAPHHIDLQAVFGFLALQAAWNFTAAVWMVRGLRWPVEAQPANVAGGGPL